MIIVPKEDFDAEAYWLESMIQSARAYRISKRAPFSDLQDVQAELRKRRMAFLGSSVPMPSIVCSAGTLDEEAIMIFSNYLADLTIHFWRGENEPTCDRFCRQFYILAIRALLNPKLDTPCLDDLIQLADLLTNEPKSIFVSVMKDLLPEDWHGLLFILTDSMDGQDLQLHLSASFSDAVLGAVAVCLDVLEDPFAEAHQSEEEEWEGGVICV